MPSANVRPQGSTAEPAALIPPLADDELARQRALLERAADAGRAGHRRAHLAGMRGHPDGPGRRPAGGAGREGARAAAMSGERRRLQAARDRLARRRAWGAEARQPADARIADPEPAIAAIDRRLAWLGAEVLT